MLGSRKTTIPLPEPPVDAVKTLPERKLNPSCPCCGKEMLWREELKRLDLWAAVQKECEIEKPPKKPKWKRARPRPPNKRKSESKPPEEAA